MAWGAIMYKLPEGCKFEDLPNDYKPSVIGTPEEISAVLKDLFPNHEHQLGRTTYLDEACYVEFGYAEEGIVDHISIRTNAGKTALSTMKKVCEEMCLSMYDIQSGETADFTEITQNNMSEYRAWGEQVIG